MEEIAVPTPGGAAPTLATDGRPTEHRDPPPDEIALAPSENLHQPEMPIEERLRRMTITELSEYTTRKVTEKRMIERPSFHGPRFSR